VATPGGEDATPDPIEHATPDVELAEAQLAVGRPPLEPDEVTEDEPEPVSEAESEPQEEPEEDHRDEDYEDEDEDYDEDEEYEPDEEDVGGSGGGPPVGTAVAATGPGVPAARPRSGNRLIGFLQGSWRELQRVQWPDRRQVVQATGVVIGFVIVAGLYLALADFAATKLMNYILK